MINETEIKALINDVKCNQDDYGFEVYAVVKGDSNQSQMRRIAFYEWGPFLRPAAPLCTSAKNRT